MSCGGVRIVGRVRGEGAHFNTEERRIDIKAQTCVVLTDSRSQQRAEVREHSSMWLLVVRIRPGIRRQTQSALCFTSWTSIWVCVTCLVELFSVIEQLESGSSSLSLCVMGCFDSQSASCVGKIGVYHQEESHHYMTASANVLSRHVTVFLCAYMFHLPTPQSPTRFVLLSFHLLSLSCRPCSLLPSLSQRFLPLHHRLAVFSPFSPQPDGSQMRRLSG